MPADSPDPPAAGRVTEALEALAVPFPGEVAGASLPDALGEALADARVIGLGEATHGTREFVEVRSRICRALIEARELDAVALETNVSATLALDEYVRGERDDLDAALSSGTVNWPYRVASVRSFLEWLRSHNADRGPENRVRIYGFDVVKGFAAAPPLQRFLAAADATDLAGEDLAYLLARVDGRLDPEELSRERLEEAEEAVLERLEDALDDRERDLVAATSERALRWARRHLETVALNVELFDAGDPTVRESGMADTVAWILEHEPVDRIALWGHNSHLKRGTLEHPDGTDECLGTRLERRYGGDYVAIGTEFVRGTVRAITTGEQRIEYTTVDVPDPPESSLPGVFADHCERPVFLSLAPEDLTGVLKEWWATEPRRHHLVGSADVDDDDYVTSNAPAEFDGLVVVPASTPTEPVAPVQPAFQD